MFQFKSQPRTGAFFMAIADYEMISAVFLVCIHDHRFPPEAGVNIK